MANLPYSPPVFAINHPLAPKEYQLYMGGQDTKEKHMEGQRLAWEDTIKFFNKTLK